MYKITGVEGSKSYQFYFASDELALGELVGFKSAGNGLFDLSMLEFIAEKGEWTVWTGKAATSPTKLSGKMVLRQAALTNSGPIITLDKNKKLAMVKTKQLRISVSNGIFMESNNLFVRCHDCKVDILFENFAIHTARIHGYIPTSIGHRILGRLIVDKEDQTIK